MGQLSLSSVINMDLFMTVQNLTNLQLTMSFFSVFAAARYPTVEYIHELISDSSWQAIKIIAYLYWSLW